MADRPLRSVPITRWSAERVQTGPGREGVSTPPERPPTTPSPPHRIHTHQSPKPPTEDEDTLSLGASLGPVLRDACEGRLGEIEWFRSTWQRGGAATGFSTWKRADGESIRVMVKVPVGAREYSWTTRLGTVGEADWHAEVARELPTPRVVASGLEVGSYDMAWLIVERFEGRPVSRDLCADSIRSVMEAAAEFQKAAQLIGCGPGRPEYCQWSKLIRKSRERVYDCGIPEPDRWARTLDRLEGRLHGVLERWWARPMNGWCHGDLHPGNAMRREHNGRWALIDLGLVHPGHWVEDAVYFERLFWGHEDKLGGVNPVEAMAEARKRHGLPVCERDHELADIRRLLTASCVPVFLAREGHPAYVRSAIERLERLVDLFGRRAG